MGKAKVTYNMIYNKNISLYIEKANYTVPHKYRLGQYDSKKKNKHFLSNPLHKVK